MLGLRTTRSFHTRGTVLQFTLKVLERSTENRSRCSRVCDEVRTEHFPRRTSFMCRSFLVACWPARVHALRANKFGIIKICAYFVSLPFLAYLLWKTRRLIQSPWCPSVSLYLLTFVFASVFVRSLLRALCCRCFPIFFFHFRCGPCGIKVVWLVYLHFSCLSLYPSFL